MKQSADSNLKFDKNGRKFSKQVENTVGKEEIARYEQFLRFPPCFLKACFPGASKGVIVWEWVKLVFAWSRSILTHFFLPVEVCSLLFYTDCLPSSLQHFKQIQISAFADNRKKWNSDGGICVRNIENIVGKGKNSIH